MEAEVAVLRIGGVAMCRLSRCLERLQSPYPLRRRGGQ